MKDRIISENPKIGVVVGTFAAIPYVHLQLESWKKYYPEVPILIHDDRSNICSDLSNLCDSYSAEFYSTEIRYGHQTGDLHASYKGLDWASNNNIELLVKLSRTFIPISDFRNGLKEAAYESQYTTYSNVCKGWGFGFRSECMVLHVPSYSCVMGDLKEKIANGRDSFGFVEMYMHQLSDRTLKDNPSVMNEEYKKDHPRNDSTNNYGWWPWMGNNGTLKWPGFLWHRSHSPEDYFQLSQSYGLHYRLSDFKDTNMGQGGGPGNEW